MEKTIEKDPRKQLFLVVVNHLQADGDEKNNPIPVNDLGDHAHGRAVCYPDTETVLSQVQINILKDATVDLSLPVPEDSGIMQESNPLRAAEAHYKGFTASMDRNTGRMMLRQQKKRFSVSVIKPYVPAKPKTTAPVKE